MLWRCDRAVPKTSRSPAPALIFTGEHYAPMKVPLHPAPPSLIRLLTMRADCVEGNASLAIIGTLLVARVFFKVISVAPPVRQTDTLPVSQSAPAFFAWKTSPLPPS